MKARDFIMPLLLISLVLGANKLFSQTPQGFNYQAIVRDGSGSPIANKSIGIKITLQNALQVAYYTETQTATSNGQGVISVNIGSGTQVGGSQFTSIPWKNGEIFIKIEIDPNGGASYISMGTPSKLMSVPYALFADNTKEVVSLPNATDDDPIFVVRNKAGQIVFAVYQTGVRVFVEDSPIVKGAKGGFAIGGLTNQAKTGSAEYMRITSDSARIYINETTTKGAKGGFAIGGLTNQAKTVVARDLMYVAPDSTRIYVNETVTKGAKGGFAIGGLTNQAKDNASQFLSLTPENYLIGKDAGKNITTGKYNSFIGYQSGYNNKEGYKNYFIGYSSGYNNLSGVSNIYVGDSTGFSNTTGKFNIFMGNQSGFTNTTGGYNIFLGFHAGYTNNSNYNIFMGYESGKLNTIGQNNTFLGYQAGYKHVKNSSNIFIGNSSGYSDSTGNYNIFLGYKAGYANKTGQFNVIIGNDAGGSAINHFSCVYIGNTAGKYRTDSGSGNVFIGNTSGQYGSGNYNTCLGSDAGSTVVGSQNTCIGQAAGKATTGSNNLFLGYAAGSFLGTISDRVILGNSSISSFYCQGAYAATTASAANLYVNSSGQIMRSTSSLRYKKDISDLKINSSLIYKLHPVSYTSVIDNLPYFGLVAEEVAEIIPELTEYAVEKQVIPGSSSDKLIPDAVKYPVLSVLLLNEMQKHEKEIVDLTSTIEKLNIENAILKDQVKKLNDLQSNFDTLQTELEQIKAMLKK